MSTILTFLSIICSGNQDEGCKVFIAHCQTQIIVLILVFLYNHSYQTGCKNAKILKQLLAIDQKK